MLYLLYLLQGQLWLLHLLLQLNLLQLLLLLLLNLLLLHLVNRLLQPIVDDGVLETFRRERERERERERARGAE